MKTETTGSLLRKQQHAPLWLVVAAFAAVYTIWGSTYLGIRYAVQTIPPFMMAGSRQLAAGIFLFAFSRFRGAAKPSLIEWRDAAIAGTLMLTIGNGGVRWAEQRIPSGMAALLVALTPLWMALADWLRPRGKRPTLMISAGLLLGIAGVALLARLGEHREAAYGWSVAALLASSIGWACGSIFRRSARKPASAFLGVAMQLLAGSAGLLGLAGARGEFRQFAFNHVTALSFGSWLYLVIAGSLVGYTAYVWLLHVSTPARVSTYAYVNPLIAVLLGCTLGHEVFSHEMLLAAVIIIASVVLIVRGGNRSVAEKDVKQTVVESTAVPISE